MSGLPVVEQPLVLPSAGVTGAAEEVAELLERDGYEVVLVMVDGEVLFARVVGALQVRRWGRVASEPIDLAGVRRAAVVPRMMWATVQRIAREQREGRRLVVGRRRRITVETPKEKGGCRP